MDFRYSTEQDDFCASLRGFLRDHAGGARVREVAAADGHDSRLWQRLCSEMELPALHTPSEYGGVGATLVETAIAFSELGRTLTPVPFAATTFAIEAILRLGDDEQRKSLLPGLLSGEQIGAFAAAGYQVTRRVRGNGTGAAARRRVVLTGECTAGVAWPRRRSFCRPRPGRRHRREPARGGRRLSWGHRRPAALIRHHPPGRQAAAGAGPGRCLGGGLPGRRQRVLDVARVLLAAEMLGGAEACLELAVEYACSRKQFDRPIGSFQAIKHACAEMLIEIDATRAAVMFAAMSAASGKELHIAAPLVKAQAADTYVLCAGTAIQVHGGIAFTWEHDLHLYFRRAKSTEALFGSSARHRALLANRAGL